MGRPPKFQSQNPSGDYVGCSVLKCPQRSTQRKRGRRAWRLRMQTMPGSTSQLHDLGQVPILLCALIFLVYRMSWKLISVSKGYDDG